MLAFIGTPLRDFVPEALKHGALLGHEAWQWLGVALAALVSYPVGRMGSAIAVRIGSFFAKKTAPPFDDALVVAARRPVRLLLGAVTFREATELLELAPGLTKVVDHVSFTLLLYAFAWFVARALDVGAEWAEHRADGKNDEVRTRAVRTRIVLMKRIATAALVTVTIAMFLLQFDVVRSVGMSLLASAGIAGIVLGLAAQKTIGATIAGVQLSITQPIRIGDTVLVDKDWGEIQEINLTYVVIKLADGRSQIVPIQRFLDQPFENWTMPDPKLVGAVTMPVDFSAPLDKLRAELRRVCEASALWDGRIAELRVVDVTETAMQLRATVSAADPSAAASLRLDVREALVVFLRDLDGGAHLPKGPGLRAS